MAHNQSRVVSALLSPRIGTASLFGTEISQAKHGWNAAGQIWHASKVCQMVSGDGWGV
jgi:hypothetical protein